MDSNPLIHSLLVIVAITVAFLTIMLLVAFTVLAERRVLAFIQGRVGPNRVGFGGVLQPFADFIKTMMKEDLVPDQSTRFVFLLAPMIAVVTAIMTIIVYPFGPTITIPFLHWTFPLVIAGFDRRHSDFRHAGHLQHRRTAVGLVRHAVEYFLSTARVHSLSDCCDCGN